MARYRRASEQDSLAPDYELDHDPYLRTPFADQEYFGCEVASAEAAMDATKATGKTFDTWLTGADFDEHVEEGVAWGDDDPQ